MIFKNTQWFLAVIISLAMTFGFTSPVFADSEINWNTDNHDYYHRDTIQIWGSVYPLEDDEIILEIENSKGEIVFSRTADVKSNGNFEENITILGGIWQPDGQFTLNLVYGDNNNSQPIWIYQSESTAPIFIEPSIFFDKPAYALTDVVNFWIVSPDSEKAMRRAY